MKHSAFEILLVPWYQVPVISFAAVSGTLTLVELLYRWRRCESLKGSYTYPAVGAESGKYAYTSMIYIHGAGDTPACARTSNWKLQRYTHVHTRLRCTLHTHATHGRRYIHTEQKRTHETRDTHAHGTHPRAHSQTHTSTTQTQNMRTRDTRTPAHTASYARTHALKES